MMKGVNQIVIFESHYQPCFSLVDTLLSWLFSPPMLAFLTRPKLWQWPSRKQLKRLWHQSTLALYCVSVDPSTRTEALPVLSDVQEQLKSLGHAALL